MRVLPLRSGQFGFASQAPPPSRPPAARLTGDGNSFGNSNPYLPLMFPDRTAQRYQAIAADRLRNASQLHIVQRYEAVASEYLALKGLAFGGRK